VVLTNPANPTGATLPVTELQRLLEGLERGGIRLVLDESFTDFVDGSNNHTLAQEETLLRHPGLVIVKSVSKAHGIPGLRLGVIVSGDALLVKNVTGRLPIWNVNALAEAFLQRVGRYEQAFQDACKAVVEERQWLHLQIESRVPSLRPLPSGGNFLLCEVRGGRSAREIAECLLAEDSILSKECSGKRGLEGAEYLRFAVRARPENQLLVDALARLGVTNRHRLADAPA
jgi:histidinol-phosphate/aromatic aminotransferase/cobyric acid decarboxylase-like protein